jgi:hypothetical protein
MRIAVMADVVTAPGGDDLNGGIENLDSVAVHGAQLASFAAADGVAVECMKPFTLILCSLRALYFF